jgi:putative transposase
MRYRRAFVPGGSFFFTVVMQQRRPILASVEAVEVLRMALRTVRSNRPFEVDVMVVLPDHLHCIWTLPPDDSDFACRTAPGRRSGNRHCGSTGIGSMCCATKRILAVTWTTSITTR